ncbi:MAG: rhodanese-like domain-containing protein [Flavobacteriales bacterium]|jgi:rhodanese-related sulfurtransferase|nr:rhodanese-like domain-containing protein [Flavobacteriales bacterium]
MKQLLKPIFAVSTLLFFSCSEEQAQEQNHNHNTTEQHASPAQQNTTIAKNVNVQEFKKLIENEAGTIVDVRTPGEFSQGNIKNALNINISGNFSEEIQKLDKNKPVYLYCRSGGRSSRAMQTMTQMGFKEVYNLMGGYMAWSRQ